MRRDFALPWLAYRLALPHGGQLGALLASAVPLIAWMSWDLLRYRHFDALSAIVLAVAERSALGSRISCVTGSTPA